MREPYTQLYVHLVWATWDRLPLLIEEVEARVYVCIRKECEELDAEVLAIGGVENHLHLLVRIPTKLSIAELMKQIKGSSSHLVTRVVKPGEFFKWQGAYGAFTLSKGEVPIIRDYILNQKTHHRDQTLISEFEPE